MFSLSPDFEHQFYHFACSSSMEYFERNPSLAGSVYNAMDLDRPSTPVHVPFLHSVHGVTITNAQKALCLGLSTHEIYIFKACF